jgi:hypothetical protein
MEEHTGNPIWKIHYVGAEHPEIVQFLSQAQAFVATHDITAINFYVNVFFKAPGINTEKDFSERAMTKEELLSLNDAWVQDTMKETAHISYKYFTGRDTPQ